MKLGTQTVQCFTSKVYILYKMWLDFQQQIKWVKTDPIQEKKGPLWLPMNALLDSSFCFIKRMAKWAHRNSCNSCPSRVDFGKIAIFFNLLQKLICKLFWKTSNSVRNLISKRFQGFWMFWSAIYEAQYLTVWPVLFGFYFYFYLKHRLLLYFSITCFSIYSPFDLWCFMHEIPHQVDQNPYFSLFLKSKIRQSLYIIYCL